MEGSLKGIKKAQEAEKGTKGMKLGQEGSLESRNKAQKED